MTTIGSQAFYSCTSLLSVTLSPTLQRIGTKAFGDCFRLAEVINLGGRMIVTGEDAKTGQDFSGGVGAYALLVHNGESELDLFEDCYFLTVQDKHYLIAYAGNATKVVLPESYRGEEYVLHDWAFAFEETVEEIVVPDTVASIGAYAFFGCTSLTRIVLPSGLECIADHTFDGCRSLADITLPAGLREIGNFAFADCRSLTAIRLPTTLSFIGSYAFYNCRSLTEFTFDGNINSWNKMDKGGYWYFRLAATQVVCRNGKTSDVPKS